MIVGVMSNEDRHRQMSASIGRFPMMKKHADKTFSDRRISLVCYGPSLMQTWHEIEGPIMTVSGAHDFLVARGIVPDWHVDCDPRPHKAGMLKLPTEDTKYLMASCCHPDFWETLKKKNVKLWHLVNGNDFETIAWVRDNHPQGLHSMICGGSTVGMRAMEVAASMGFRRFNIFGMDCSHTDQRHAGLHLGRPQAEELVRVGNRRFTTTPQMLQAAREMEQFIKTMDADITFYGDGLMQETARFLKLQKVA